MKTILLALTFLLTTATLKAKQVKFAVDMTGLTISSFGVHIVGDFQEAAGYPLNWDPSTTQLTKEGVTDIYSIIVNIPAFTKYEFRYVNGDQTYEAEFVPDESRAGYNFSDNRWIYVDSLANDVTFQGAIVFNANAPAGLKLIRYKVDVSNLSTAAFGVHVATSYDSYSPTKNRMYSFENNGIFEINHFVADGNYTYNFINGKTLSDIETSVPAPCAITGSRTLALAKDTLLPEVCFNYCVSCAITSVNEITKPTSAFKAFPNPAKNSLTVESIANETIKSISIFNLSGQEVKLINNINAANHTISDLSLSEGMYVVRILSSNNQQQHLKLIIE